VISAEEGSDFAKYHAAESPETPPPRTTTLLMTMLAVFLHFQSRCRREIEYV
jgi:hypothetical protein